MSDTSCDLPSQKELQPITYIMHLDMLGDFRFSGNSSSHRVDDRAVIPLVQSRDGGYFLVHGSMGQAEILGCEQGNSLFRISFTGTDCEAY